MRVLLIAATLAFAAPAFAHHGWESYDAGKQQKLTATVTSVKWEQPHAILYVTQGDKKLEVWLSPLQRMVDRGLKKEMLTAGKSVVVDAQPSTLNKVEWKAQSIVVDGKTYNLMR